MQLRGVTEISAAKDAENMDITQEAGYLNYNRTRQPCKPDVCTITWQEEMGKPTPVLDFSATYVFVLHVWRPKLTRLSA